MKKKHDGEYIEHITDDDSMGQAQVLRAGEDDRVKEHPDDKEKVGSQSLEYYSDYK